MVLTTDCAHVTIVPTSSRNPIRYPKVSSATAPRWFLDELFQAACDYTISWQDGNACGNRFRPHRLALHRPNAN
jgi:hypothetical protein